LEADEQEEDAAAVAAPTPVPTRPDARRSTPVPIPVQNIAMPLPIPVARPAAPARPATPPAPLPRRGTKDDLLSDVEDLSTPQSLPGKKPKGKTTKNLTPIKGRKSGRRDK
jgi:hypothetical protein